MVKFKNSAIDWMIDSHPTRTQISKHSNSDIPVRNYVIIFREIIGKFPVGTSYYFRDLYEINISNTPTRVHISVTLLIWNTINTTRRPTQLQALIADTNVAAQTRGTRWPTMSHQIHWRHGCCRLQEKRWPSRKKRTERLHPCRCQNTQNAVGNLSFHS